VWRGFTRKVLLRPEHQLSKQKVPAVGRSLKKNITAGSFSKRGGILRAALCIKKINERPAWKEGEKKQRSANPQSGGASNGKGGDFIFEKSLAGEKLEGGPVVNLET